MSKIELGCIARDKITGFQGVVIARSTYLHNCPRYTLQPRELKGGKPIDSKSFDEGALKYVGDGKLEVVPVGRTSDPVELGDTVKHKITGLVGVVTVQSTWAEGCSVLTVQPTKLKDGVPAEPGHFDEKMVTIVKRAKPKTVPVTTGGPRPEPRRW